MLKHLDFLTFFFFFPTGRDFSSAPVFVFLSLLYIYIFFSFLISSAPLHYPVVLLAKELTADFFFSSQLIFPH